jgi:hypothetical protein
VTARLVAGRAVIVRGFVSLGGPGRPGAVERGVAQTGASVAAGMDPGASGTGTAVAGDQPGALVIVVGGGVPLRAAGAAAAPLAGQVMVVVLGPGPAGRRRDQANDVDPPVVGLPGGAAVSGNLFRREGEYWTVVFDGVVVRLRDAKGLRHLARLLAGPGREFHVVDLEAATRQAGPAVVVLGPGPAGSLACRAGPAERHQGDPDGDGQPGPGQPLVGAASGRHDPDRPVLLLHPRPPRPITWQR